MPEKSTTPDLEETTRRGFEAFEQRDLDGVLAGYTPDAVWDLSTQGLGLFEGREAIRGFLQDWIGAYEDFELALHDFHDVGNGTTYLMVRQRGRLKDSNGLVEVRHAAVQTWVDTLIARWTPYAHMDEARAVAERLARGRGWAARGAHDT
jgi:ketosteroid isomerase-like protein